MTTEPTSVIGKLWSILSPAERRQLLLLLPLIAVMAVLEIAGVASIVPFLGLLSDENALEKNAKLQWVYDYFAFASRERFFFVVGIAVLVVFLLGNAVNSLVTWRLVSFSTMRASDLSVRLLGSYLRQPWHFFLGRNSADLAKNILSETQAVVTGVLGQVVNLASRAVVIVAILTVLIALDPKMATSVLVVFGGVYGTIFWSIRKSTSAASRERVHLNELRHKVASEALGGAKELKLYHLEHVAVAEFGKASSRYAALAARNSVISQLPRYAIESVAFGGLLIVVLIWLSGGKQLEDLLPVLGLFAFAAYRLLPSLQAVFAGASIIRFNLASLDVLVRDLKERKAAEQTTTGTASADAGFRRELRLDRVCYSYAGTDRLSVRNVSLVQRPGEWVALVGPTGAGKSTLVDLMLGFLTPVDGSVLVDDQSLVHDDARDAWQKHVAYVPQMIFIVDDTVERNIAFGVPANEIDPERVRWAAAVAQIHDFIASELPGGYQTAVGERGMRLSGGQRQRLGIARALYRSPKYLVLDEATSALDNVTEAAFFERLRGELKNVAVVSIAHRLSTTRHFDRVVVLEAGAIRDEGSYDAVSARDPLFQSAR